MDLILLILALLCCLLGILGSFLPVLPGPPFSWLGLLLLQLTGAVPLNGWFLLGTALIAVGVTLLDYWIPVLGTKKYGGSRAGMIGTVIGLIFSLVFPVLGLPGILFWPFIGALVGELINRANHQKALRAAFGSFVGFLAGALLKFLLSCIYFGLFLAEVWGYREAFFPWFY
ncbi:DUF456 domain-containing protein [Robiginitalea sp.]|nr:DUF456 domain-containing protein [Robiginitalea sp.]